MAKPDTWMPFYVADYLADTTHLSTLQHGAYCLLLFAGWRKGGRLPIDDEQLAAIAKLTPAQWFKNKAVLIAFFSIEDGHLVQGRMAAEYKAAAEMVEKNRLNGLKGGRPRKATSNPDETHRLSGEEPKRKQNETPSPSPSQSASSEAAMHPGRHERFGEVMKRVESLLNCPTLTVFAEVDQWLKGGADPDADIYPTLERLKSKWSGPSLKYFTQAIADAVATRKTPLPPGVPRFQGKSQPAAPALTADERARAAEQGRKTRLELAKKGIPNGSNTPHDFDDWIASGELTEDQARKAGWSGPRRLSA